MGSVVPFRRTATLYRGTIHVMAGEHGGFEIGHESASGNSWGSFERFDNASEAVVGAYRLNRETYENGADVLLHDAVVAALPDDPEPGGRAA